MAPKKQSSEEAPVWLQPILKRWDEYFNRFDRMFEFFMKMQETQNTILTKLSASEERCNATQYPDHHSSSALYSTLVKFQTDAKIVTAKSCRITWVGIGEQKDETSTKIFDREAIKEVIETSDDPDLLQEFNSGK
ncbi:hypothetical protein Y032_0062g3389 [Ancylostoma ceylanicum]|uniref:Uncharacterized protein n=1 Tax=Ancylostoma ceylanicum TaxID=53326 RepID=A0A016U215_9BILA|nr:hypothetical protein Y032_0062g3389 [Ancylostoma ceylanicum]